MNIKSPLLWLLLSLLAAVILTALGPAEKALGDNVRVVYLHGAWVWASLACILAAGLVGACGLILRRVKLNYWSRALGRTGLILWITYLPLSLWAMQVNWNGLFLMEPRWRVGVVFAVGGLLLQLGLSLIDNPAWASASNLVYMIILGITLQNTRQIMHPGSPIFSSGLWRIEVYFLILFALMVFAAWQGTRWLYAKDTAGRDLD